MSLQKGSLAQIAVVCAIASVEAGLGYGLFKAVDNAEQWQWCGAILSISVLCVLCTLVFAFPKEQRGYGFTMVAILIGTLWMFFSISN